MAVGVALELLLKVCTRVVALFGLRVGEALVGVVHLLELGLRLGDLLGGASVLVRVPLERHFAVPLLDLHRRGAARNVQDLVVVHPLALELFELGLALHLPGRLLRLLIGGLLDRGVVVLDGRVPALLFHVAARPPQDGLHALGVDFEGACAVGDGLFVALESREGRGSVHAQRAHNHVPRAAHVERRTVVLDGRFKVALLEGVVPRLLLRGEGLDQVA
mmetsp:Transcript_27949/g.82162  ORF Transcript_27949/g.82162 Transcript_27949/m.82162 type:complete len:219 (-) Transcript_27949:1432-2088(-)